MELHEKFVFWGSAGHAKVLADLIQQKGSRLVAIFDNDPRTISCLRDVPLFHGDDGFREWLAQQTSLDGVGAALAIGGAHGQDRQKIAHKLQAAGLSLPTLTHPSAVVATSVRHGIGNQILANAVVAADTSLGNVCIINNSANVDHECQLGHGVHIAPGAVLCGCVTVMANAMVGAGAVILPRITIGIGAVVGAGAVVTRNVPAGSIVVGNPAKPIKTNQTLGR
jgi:sugar O-acyltransferase (sialic acid O-acetyltransferase NeuD family)